MGDFAQLRLFFFIAAVLLATHSFRIPTLALFSSSLHSAPQQHRSVLSQSSPESFSTAVYRLPPPPPPRVVAVNATAQLPASLPPKLANWIQRRYREGRLGPEFWQCPLQRQSNEKTAAVTELPSIEGLPLSSTVPKWRILVTQVRRPVELACHASFSV